MVVLADCVPPRARHPQPTRRAAVLSGALGSLLLLSGTASRAATPALTGRPADDAADSLPQFSADGALLSEYDEYVSFKVLRSGEGGWGTAQMLGNWVQEKDGTLVDPVLGEAATSVSFLRTASPLKKTSDLGRPEYLSAKKLGLGPELERADMVAASKRVANGVEFYEYDLALPALQCVPELATACLPEKVVLVSCCVLDGAFHVLQVDVQPDGWRRAGKALKNLRSTFAVASAAK